MHSRMVLSLGAHSIPKQIAHSNASPCPHTTKRCAGRRKRSRGNQGLKCKKSIRLERSGGAGGGRCTLPLCGLIGGSNGRRGRCRRRRPQDVRRRDERRSSAPADAGVEAAPPSLSERPIEMRFISGQGGYVPNEILDFTFIGAAAPKPTSRGD